MSHSDGTRVVRAGLPAPQQGEPFMPGPVFAGPFHLRGEVASSDWAYTRYGNPTWSRYERALGELEGGEVVLFASGMAAASALLLTALAPGSAVAMDHGCYRGVRILAEAHLEPRGVDVRLALPERLGDALEGADVLWMESPSNPKLEVYDLAALAEAAHAAGAIVVVDNTTAGPLHQKALELGADYVLTSATKHLSGHADLMLGYLATADAARAQALRDWRTRSGSIAGPFEVWLAHRSLPTYALRLERGSANALALAELLAGREDVTGVRYPGLPSDPGHGVARRQMRGYGTIVAFDVGERERAERFLAAAELVTEASSFGAVQTTAERRGRWSGDDVTEGFIRLSAGCEDSADLLGDVERALAAAIGARLVHVSTDVVFDGEKGSPYVERDEPTPITDYGRDKADAERGVLAEHPAALVVRTSLIYGGPEPGPQERMAADPEASFFTDEFRCPVQVGDLAAALLELVGTEEAGILHVAGAERVSRAEFAELLAGAPVRTATIAESGLRRPRDCALSIDQALALLRTRLRGVREVLGAS